MSAVEPPWFSRLSEPTLQRAREWLRADPAAFAEIIQADKRGRPRAALGPGAAFESMARLLTDDPGMPVFTAARMSVHLVEENTAVSRSIVMRLTRQWLQVSRRYLRAEEKRRRLQDAASLSMYGISGLLALDRSNPERAAVIRAIEEHARLNAEMQERYAPGFATLAGLGIAGPDAAHFMPPIRAED
ncbi:hypothetical protein [Roseomonas populi]|uniref:Uncharacterized protein n=1 Tax=Roseomonas populi TaxID=3121582 RepID=A0ABT1X0B8_9PROT|nr:hypothetical protein [Roseomonas pecuniae]MCR0980627.1 hypothetical protein [Roseomonas pecuniae]